MYLGLCVRARVHVWWGEGAGGGMYENSDRL